MTTATATATKTVECIFSNNNEWTQKWDTFVGIAGKVNVDMNKQHTLLVSNDNWQQYEVNKYQVKQIEIPEWLYNGFIKLATNDEVENVEEFATMASISTLTGFYKYGNELMKSTLKELTAYRTKSNKFIESLQEWFSNHGYFTRKQMETAINISGGYKRR